MEPSKATKDYIKPDEAAKAWGISAIDPDAWQTVSRLYKIYHSGWSKLSGGVIGRTVITSLSQKEREMAKLAAFGFSNSEIAEKLNMSIAA